MATPVGCVQGGRAVPECADRLERDSGGARVPGGLARDEEGRGESGGRGREGAEHQRRIKEVTDSWHRLERGSGRSLRRFRLPKDARVDQVRATMENGVLMVVVPKVATAAGATVVARPDVKPIPITGWGVLNVSDGESVTL